MSGILATRQSTALANEAGLISQLVLLRPPLPKAFPAHRVEANMNGLVVRGFREFRGMSEAVSRLVIVALRHSERPKNRRQGRGCRRRGSPLFRKKSDAALCSHPQPLGPQKCEGECLATFAFGSQPASDFQQSEHSCDYHSMERFTQLLCSLCLPLFPRTLPFTFPPQLRLSSTLQAVWPAFVDSLAESIATMLTQWGTFFATAKCHVCLQTQP